MILIDIVIWLFSFTNVYKKGGITPPHLLKYDNKTVEGVSKFRH